MSPLLRPVCWLMSGFYSLRYWLRGGVLSVIVNGHRYIETPTSYWLDGDIEWHVLTCELCGSESRAWRFMAERQP